MSLVKINNLVKRYNQVIAVDNLSLDIAEGEIFGFLGPNGAGKSTTINAICGLVKPTQGEILIDGLIIKNEPLKVKERLGLVPQEIALFPTLKARENVEFFGKLAGLKGEQLKNKVQEALELVGLAEHSKGLAKNFSGGMKRRLNIACAIVHQPRLIIMDEPTVGIDPQSRNHILETVRLLNKRGSTIIYTSHYMEEVEAVCSRIAIIDQGRLIACGSKEELKSLVAEEEKLLIEVLDYDYNTLAQLKDIRGVKDAHLTGNTLEIIVTSAQKVLQDVMVFLAQHGVRIKGVNLMEPDLETVFLSLTGKRLRD
ncbi:MAG: ABC transporter ATP-binding protein [Peptococcia bacterium]